MTPFPNAEVFARAIIAAAKVYEDRPDYAFAMRGRRAVVAAACALANVTQEPAARVGRILAIDPAILSRASSPKAQQIVALAIRAAEAAAINAWRLQAMRAPREADEPRQPPPRTKPVVLTAGALARRVHQLILEDPATAPELASFLNVGEAQVREALAALADKGAIRADPITAEGWRVQTWRIARS